MNGLASADLSAASIHGPDDGLVALVRWRLSDPAWIPSFADLLEDARTCTGPGAEAAMVLAALREAVMADFRLAAAARQLAVEAGHAMASRSRSAPRPVASESPPRDRWSGMAAAAAKSWIHPR